MDTVRDRQSSDLMIMNRSTVDIIIYYEILMLIYLKKT